jgi:hypothetical protein
MNFFSKKSLPARFTSILLMVVAYFFAIRPLRALHNEYVVYSILLNSSENWGLANEAFLVPRSVLIHFASGESELVLAYMPQFGFFFLFGMLGVLYFLPSIRTILILPALQAVIEVLVLVFLLAGIHFSVAGFIAADFMIVYLSPLVCLGFVVFIFAEEKANRETSPKDSSS